MKTKSALIYNSWDKEEIKKGIRDNFELNRNRKKINIFLPTKIVLLAFTLWQSKWMKENNKDNRYH